MKKETIGILSILIVLLACKVDSETISVKGNWILSQSDIEPLNLYGSNYDLKQGASLNFKENGILEIKNPTYDSSSTLKYKIFRDTIIQYLVDYTNVVTDTTSIIYIGNENSMLEYRIKRLTNDSLSLISRYRKESLILPKPNEFKTNPDMFKDYEIILTREK